MEAARDGANAGAAEQALGELLLGAAAWAFREGMDPEAALRGAVKRLAAPASRREGPSPRPPG